MSCHICTVWQHHVDAECETGRLAARRSLAQLQGCQGESLLVAALVELLDTPVSCGWHLHWSFIASCYYLNWSLPVPSGSFTCFCHWLVALSASLPIDSPVRGSILLLYRSVVFTLFFANMQLMLYMYFASHVLSFMVFNTV